MTMFRIDSSACWKEIQTAPQKEIETLGFIRERQFSLGFSW